MLQIWFSDLPVLPSREWVEVRRLPREETEVPEPIHIECEVYFDTLSVYSQKVQMVATGALVPGSGWHVVLPALDLDLVSVAEAALQSAVAQTNLYAPGMKPCLTSSPLNAATAMSRITDRLELTKDFFTASNPGRLRSASANVWPAEVRRRGSADHWSIPSAERSAPIPGSPSPCSRKPSSLSRRRWK
jgi:hypothetical protein